MCGILFSLRRIQSRNDRVELNASLNQNCFVIFKTFLLTFVLWWTLEHNKLVFCSRWRWEAVEKPFFLLHLRLPKGCKLHSSASSTRHMGFSKWGGTFLHEMKSLKFKALGWHLHPEQSQGVKDESTVLITTMCKKNLTAFLSLVPH